MPAPPMQERMECALLAMLMVVVLLWVIMPVLLYLLGWAVVRYTKKPGVLAGSPVNKPDGEVAARV
jgi:hypothetical protein